jgi:hypothetical protein
VSPSLRECDAAGTGDLLHAGKEALAEARARNCFQQGGLVEITRRCDWSIQGGVIGH